MWLRLATIPKRLTARTAKGKLDMEEPEAKAEAEAEDEGRSEAALMHATSLKALQSQGIVAGRLL